MSVAQNLKVWIGFGLVAAVLAACASDPAPAPQRESRAPAPQTSAPRGDDGRPNLGIYDRDFRRSQRRREYDPSRFLTPPHMEAADPVRVGLLLPFSAPSEGAREIAAELFDAAQLAVFDAGDRNLLLIPKDTQGTAAGAARAADAALAEGAELILGPLFAQSVVAAADVARAARKPMIAFSSDMRVAGDGVYLLSFPPELEVARITDYAMLQGYQRFAAMIPQSEYGRRVGDSFAEELFVRLGELVQEETYEQDPQAMFGPAKRLAHYDSRRAALRSERAKLRALGDDAVAQGAQAALASRETYGGVSYEAVLLPEEGNLLRALAPLLPYFDVDTRLVKLLGTSLWYDETLAREPALAGGWFAAPDPEGRQAFVSRFEDAYGRKPNRLASLAYDAGTLVARLARRRPRDRFAHETFSDPSGFLGVDGVFRFDDTGRVERGLAVLEVRSGSFRVIDPAPRSFSPALN